MTSTYTVPKVPNGLGLAGRRLWARVVTKSDLEFMPHEIVLLEEAAHAVDVIAGLRRGFDPKKPDAKVAREIRLAGEHVRKLLTSIGWPSGDSSSWEGLSTSERGRRAAFVRWSR